MLKPGFADGCKHVYLDFGGNMGVHTRFLLQPQLYPKLQTYGTDTEEHRKGPGFYGEPNLHTYFNAAFGLDRSDVCVFGFEPNPLHGPRLRQIERCFSTGTRVVKYFNPAGIGIEDGMLYFLNLDKDHAIMWSGMIGTAEEVKTWQSTLGPGKLTNITVIDVLRFFKLLYSRSYDKSNGYGNIHMKMDIEGSEILVLPLLEKSGLLCQDGYGFKSMNIEFHPAKFEYYKKEGHPFMKPFSSYAHLETYYANYSNFPKPGCSNPTKIWIYDTEDYKEDTENPLASNCPSGRFNN